MKSVSQFLGLDKLFGKKTREESVIINCGCVCYCPSCKDILNDQAKMEDTDLVRYTCSCGHKSTWNFDICPVPILVGGFYLKFRILGVGGFTDTHKGVFEFLKDEFENSDDPYTIHFEEVYMTKEEFEGLSEFDGF